MKRTGPLLTEETKAKRGEEEGERKGGKGDGGGKRNKGWSKEEKHMK